MQTTVILTVNYVSLSFCLWHTYPAPTNLLRDLFWINKDPGVCYKCAHTMCSVCVCICAHRICSSVQQRKEVTRWWGFQNWAAAVEEALCIVCFLFSSPSACAPFCYVSSDSTLALRSGRGFEKSHFISAHTDYPWKHNGMHDRCICVRSTLWIANMAHVSKRSVRQSIFIWWDVLCETWLVGEGSAS